MPRVTFASWPHIDKHAHFTYLWDGDAASVQKRLADTATPSCASQPSDECHTVVSVQRVHQAIKAALQARSDPNWEIASADRHKQLERLQRHGSFDVWKKTLTSSPSN